MTHKPSMLRKLTGPMAGLVAGVGLSLFLFAYVVDDVRRDAQLQFERRAADAKHIIEKRLRSYVGVTYGLRALFAANESVTRAQFNGYVQSLNLQQNYPGFVLLNYARHLKAEERTRFVEEVRRDASVSPQGYPKFAIRPPGQRPEYHVLVYLEPMEGNEYAMGLDLAGVRPEAIYLQRDSGELISSGRLVQAGPDGYVALSMRLGVYRNGVPLETVEQRRAAYIGSVGAGYNVHKLMYGVLDETTMTSIRYQLYDAGAVGEPKDTARPTLLFDSAQPAPGAPQDDFIADGDPAIFKAVLSLQLAGRDWQLHFSAPKTAFIERSDLNLPWIVLAGGLLCSALLFVVLYSLASARERAITLAGIITRELRESEASLAHAQALARLGSWTLDVDTGEMTWSAEVYRLLRLDPTAVLPGVEAFVAWLGDEDRSAFHSAATRSAETGAPRSLEFRMQPGVDEVRWMHFILQPVSGAGRREIRGTLMDVTERKLALETQRANAAQIRDLLRRLVTVQEAERRRFSADLHDLVGQSLSVLSIGLETIRGTLSAGASQRARTTFLDMEQLLKETMGAVREVMSDLRPPLLDDYGLYAAVEWHARQLEARTGLRITVQGGVVEPRPAPEVEMALFRIVQEALTNVAKHARSANSVSVIIERVAGTVRLTVDEIFAVTILAPILRDLHDAHPGIRIELVCAVAKRDLAAGEADVALRSTKASSDIGLVGRRVGSDSWTLYCSRDYAAAHARPHSAADLREHPIIGGGGEKIWPRYRAWLQRLKLEGAVTMQASSGTGLLAAVRAGARQMGLAEDFAASVALSVDAATSALQSLKQLAPLQKALLVKGLFATVTADGRINVAEAEMMRLVGAVLDCPLPPLVIDDDALALAA